MVKPFIIGTANSKDMLHAGAEILRKGGSAIDAVEASVRLVESNPSDTSVGLGGIPNLFGDVELDASIMDGRTLRTGAVGAVKGYLHVISIARRVMEETPHVMLVGEGAEMFADRFGFEKQDLSTEESRTVYKNFIEGIYGKWPDDDPKKPWYVGYIKDGRLREWYDRLSDKRHGTVNVMAMDGNRNICVGVSTSGTALKFPGRLGDSPVIGAGNYCDNRFGACACTGRGELSIRLSLARTIVGYMENGAALRDACAHGMHEINRLKETGNMNCLAMDREGNTMSASSTRENPHWYMDTESKAPEERKGIIVRD